MVEAEYVNAGSCCAQLLWMRQTLKDYGYTINHIPLLCDNESAIKIAYGLSRSGVRCLCVWLYNAHKGILSFHKLEPTTN
jgi:hypothetical protein